MMFCSHCGVECRRDAQFCHKCGKPVAVVAPAIPVAAPPPAGGDTAAPYRAPQAALEEIVASEEVVYAGFWRRFGAAFVDGLITALLAGAVVMFLMMFGLAGRGSGLIGALVGWLYLASGESGPHGGALGKRWFNLMVLDDEGYQISFGRASIRYVARTLSAVLCYIGYLIQPFTARRQTLHDMISGTVVIENGPMGSATVVLVVVLGLMLPVGGIVAAIAIPAYQDYTMRAHAQEGYMAARAAGVQVEKFYNDHKAIPATLDEAGYTQPRSKALDDISVDSRTGTVRITFAGGSPDMKKTLDYVPTVDGNGDITWKCSSSLPDKQLPLPCREAQPQWGR